MYTGYNYMYTLIYFDNVTPELMLIHFRLIILKKGKKRERNGHDLETTRSRFQIQVKYPQSHIGNQVQISGCILNNTINYN